MLALISTIFAIVVAVLYAISIVNLIVDHFVHADWIFVRAVLGCALWAAVAYFTNRVRKQY